MKRRSVVTALLSGIASFSFGFPAFAEDAVGGDIGTLDTLAIDTNGKLSLLKPQHIVVNGVCGGNEVA